MLSTVQPTTINSLHANHKIASASQHGSYIIQEYIISIIIHSSVDEQKKMKEQSVQPLKEFPYIQKSSSIRNQYSHVLCVYFVCYV